MPLKPQLFLAVLLVLILAHLVLVQSPSSPNSHVRIQGRWAAVRHSLHLPALAAHAKPPPNLLPLSLHISSRFDLKHKRALEEPEFSFADADAPPHLYFAADALTDDPLERYGVQVAEKAVDATPTVDMKKGKQRTVSDLFTESETRAPERIRHPKEGRFARIAPTPASRPAHHKGGPRSTNAFWVQHGMEGECRRSALGECSLDAQVETANVGVFFIVQRWGAVWNMNMIEEDSRCTIYRTCEDEEQEKPENRSE
ncbi:hypothetical protein B0H16DRAFT_1451715 [Mycena metata]|uniref:Uncharacterized protein n=1 Tax=Mycena metata TaxID=1033252 RepID=A0AAD7NR50_9AGAR|nr:hypothetical protein B0H16DRAFT_1451715 [Mycena metata]